MGRDHAGDNDQSLGSVQLSLQVQSVDMGRVGGAGSLVLTLPEGQRFSGSF